MSDPAAKKARRDLEGKERVQVLDDFKNSDLDATRQEYVFKTPFLANAFGHLLNDQRDMPMMCLILNIMEYVIPGVSLLYYINLMENPPSLYVRNLCGAAYVIGNVLLFEERFILMMHYQSHLPIFKRSFNILNSFVCWIMAPFYGIPSGVYRLHHVIMHHRENNHELDISSTETYQRDSLLCFLMYYIRFAALIYLELPLYCIKTARWKHLATVSLGCASWLGGIVALAKFVDFWATFWAFIVPALVAFLAMSFGNWSQHIFVDPSRPESNYHLTYNCIDTPNNRRTFNDGYHVIHHYKAGEHWSVLPQHFHSEEAMKKHEEEGAITFRQIHFFDVGLYVMSGRLRQLAKYYVHLGPKETAPTVDEVVDKMRSWLKRMPAVKAKKM